MAVDEDDGFFARHRGKIIFAIIALLGAGAVYIAKTNKPAETKAASAPIVSIKPLPSLPHPPPPPPPPKPPPPQQKQEKMEAEAKPEDKPPDAPKPAEKPAETLGTNLKGADGEGLAGLGGSGNGGGLFGGPGGGGGSKWGWYAGQVQGTVANALRKNSATKTAKMTIQVRIWPDATTGRITRVNLDGTTGDPKLDKAIQETLNGLQLQQPPPSGMRLPIVMRLTARRP